MQALVQYPATFEVATEIVDHVGTILAHTQYGKGLKKPKSKGQNPYYIPYHRADVVGADAGPVSMELGKTTLKYWTFGGPHYYLQCPNRTGSSFDTHQKKKNIYYKTQRITCNFVSLIWVIEAGAGGCWAQIG